MTSADELRYAAIITVKLPGKDTRATVTVTLLPPDLVPVTGGKPKPLRDCTLAELEAFAGSLEAEVWESYRQQSLGELAEEEEISLTIKILDESGSPVEPAGVAAQPPTEDQPMQAGTEQLAPVEEEEILAEEPVAAEPEPAEHPSEPSPEDEPVEAHETPVPDEELPEAPEAPPPPGGDGVAVSGVVPEAPVESQPPAAPAREMRIAGLRRPLGHPSTAAADILINETAFRNAQAHALSSPDREVAGMLVGPPPEKQPDGRYVVHVSDVIIAKHTRMHGASVTYTPESWRYVTDKLQERYPNEEAVIIGWYHTHPGFGIFLSGMDLFIHQNFFTQKWHIALVLDPLARKCGFFCWDRAQTAVKPYDFPWPVWAASSW
jgi:proteasome lid subunit RPN8/RPN11